MEITWRCKFFDVLTLEELYAIMVLRQEVFIIEQDCPYLDADGRDQQSIHISGYADKNLIVYSRITLPGVRFKEVSIGRIISAGNVRNTGVGKKLMNKSLAVIRERFGNVTIRISAQTYLIKFYEKFGFKQDSKVYLEDGIDHVEMERLPSI